MSFVINNRLQFLKEAEVSPLQLLSNDGLTQKGIRLFIKRDDLLCLPEAPEFGGNKWRKMKYNLLRANELGQTTLLTFGGAYSNHIAATAAAGKLFGFKTIGIIRGEEILPLNPTLQKATANGMRFQYISRTEYRKKKEAHFIEQLKERWGDFYLIPEGGSNDLALKGCHELGTEIQAQLPNEPIHFIASACGTGGTFAGLTTAFQATTTAIGFSVLKGDFMTDEVKQFLYTFPHANTANWHINNQYHFGGFARHKPSLLTFIQDFQTSFNIPLDPLYTGKLFYGLFEQIKAGFFPKGSTIVAIHTGGLQGIAGFNERFGLKLPSK